jgi:alginate O-acetyltransferase complex protein AlgI
MVFASPIFLFLFLPLVLAAYFALPRRWGTACRWWREPGVLRLGRRRVGRARARPGCILANRVMGGKWRQRRHLGAARAANAACGNLTLSLAVWQQPVAANLNIVFGTLGLGTIALATIPLPLGISFFTFHSISYIVDLYRKNASPQRRCDSFGLYILLFPQLIAGPIIRYKDIATQITQRGRHCADFVEGVRRFIIGLGKKVLIANTLGGVADQIFGIAPHELNTPAAWLGIVCYTLQIYFDFSGYSDMAIGLMRMLGFRVLENFNYPYISQSIREFWRRWHISLSNFFPRLSVHFPGRQSTRQGARLHQSGDRVPALRSVARCETGPSSCGARGTGCS